MVYFLGHQTQLSYKFHICNQPIVGSFVPLCMRTAVRSNSFNAAAFESMFVHLLKENLIKSAQQIKCLITDICWSNQRAFSGEEMAPRKLFVIQRWTVRMKLGKTLVCETLEVHRTKWSKCTGYILNGSTTTTIMQIPLSLFQWHLLQFYSRLLVGSVIIQLILEDLLFPIEMLVLFRNPPPYLVNIPPAAF